MSYQMIRGNMMRLGLGIAVIAILSFPADARAHSIIGGPSTLAFGTLPNAVRLSSGQARPASQKLSFRVDPTAQPGSQSTGIRVPAGGLASIVGTSGTWSCSPSFPEVGVAGHKKSIRGLQVANAPLCALIGKIGNGRTWQPVQRLSGGALGFQAGSSGGELYLAANDIPASACTTLRNRNGCYLENRGEIEVTIEVR